MIKQHTLKLSFTPIMHVLRENTLWSSLKRIVRKLLIQYLYCTQIKVPLPLEACEKVVRDLEFEDGFSQCAAAVVMNDYYYRFSQKVAASVHGIYILLGVNVLCKRMTITM